MTFFAPRNYSGETKYYRLTIASAEVPSAAFLLDISVTSETELLTDAIAKLDTAHTNTLLAKEKEASNEAARLAKEAKELNLTRAALSMRKASQIQKPLIFAIGNAPTALVELCSLMEKGFRPVAVIGVPVGFVNVVAAKEMIMASGFPYIVNEGRKGGSTVAAAICNAILYGTKD